MTSPPPDPSHIMQLGLGFFGSRTLLSAVELELFTHLGKESMTASQIAERLALHPRAVPDFPDALVALRVLEREGDGPSSVYSNTPETAIFLDKASAHYIGGILEMAASRLYGFWGSLTEGLQTGKPQNEVKHSGEPVFAKLYAAPERLEQFMTAMAGVSAANYKALAESFDFSPYKTLVDAGGATGQLSCMVAAAHPHMRCTSADLPPVEPIAQRCIEKAGLSERVATAAIDFFNAPLPNADIITMGQVLHDFNLENKKHLIRLAYDALPPGGAFIAVESLIDDARRENAFGLLMSLNMMIEFGDAFDYSAADFEEWCREVGFDRFEVIPLAGPSSAAVAYKPS